MSKSRDHFTFFKSYYEAIEKLPDELDQLKIYKAITNYSLFGKTEPLEGLPDLIFELIKPVLEKGWNNYINGSKPKRKQSESKAKQKRIESEPEANEKRNANDSIVLDCIGEDCKGKERNNSKKKNTKKEKYEIERIEFNESRMLYRGKKRGNDTEFDNFIKKVSDWKDVLSKLKRLVEFDIEHKVFADGFVPNFGTFVNQRRWEEIEESENIEMGLDW